MYCRRVNVPTSISCLRLDNFFTPDFGCLYRERYFCSYSFRSFFISRFGFGFSGLYKLELALFCCFGSLYRERYFCSYSFRSFLRSIFGFDFSGLYKLELTFSFVFLVQHIYLDTSVHMLIALLVIPPV
uniref:Uncharacterized protein n=1 Tax=uncultured marine thaumarchaeote AD1000_21_E03 TaxID=1455900 RepID=A0A075FLN6_9ARCH|nr:hypothetical protein [uncultured marine thaumarchaeote AD1000_21_E03]